MKKVLIMFLGIIALVTLTGCSNNMTDYNNCVDAAQNQHNIKKDTYCRNLFNNLEYNYKNCIISKQDEHPQPIGSSYSSVDGFWRYHDGTPIQNYTFEQATELCKSAYNRSDDRVYNPNCTANKALDDSLEREKDRCVELSK